MARILLPLLNLVLFATITCAATNQGNCLLGSLCNSLIVRCEKRSKLYPQYVHVPPCFKATLQAKLVESDFGCLSELTVYRTLAKCARYSVEVVQSKALRRGRKSKPGKRKGHSKRRLPSTWRFLISELGTLKKHFKLEQQRDPSQIVPVAVRQVKFNRDTECRSCCLLYAQNEVYTRKCFELVCAGKNHEC